MNVRTSPKPAGESELVGALRRYIESGEWQPGSKLPSYSESKELFGAHSVAVERAHAQLEREGLITRERGRGTFVSVRLPQTQRTLTDLVGVAGMGFSFRDYSPYWVNLLKGIRTGCDETKKQILLLDFESNRGWEKADGVLICDWSNDMTMKFLPHGMPCVSVLVPSAEHPSVYADDFLGGRLATQHLLDLGHKKIGFMHSGDPAIAGRRLAGWREAMNGAGIDVKLEWDRTLEGFFDFGLSFVESGHETIKTWIHDGFKEAGLTALVAHNDETALGVIKGLAEAGLTVPGDVSVVGFDGAPAGSQGMAPEMSISTVQVPLADIGKAAARLLARQIQGESLGKEHLVFPVSMVAGGSSSQAQ